MDLRWASSSILWISSSGNDTMTLDIPPLYPGVLLQDHGWRPVGGTPTGARELTLCVHRSDTYTTRPRPRSCSPRRGPGPVSARQQSSSVDGPPASQPTSSAPGLHFAGFESLDEAGPISVAALKNGEVQDRLSKALTTTTLSKLNLEVTTTRQQPVTVAEAWLTHEKLV